MTSFPEPPSAAVAGLPCTKRAHASPAVLAPRRTWAALGGGAVLAAVAAAGGWELPGSRRTKAAARRTSSTIPDVPLVTDAGRPVRFHTDLVKGRVVFINMMYAQCTERCPPMTYNLKRVHDALGMRAGRDVFMYSLSLQPAFDRPSDLRAYKAQYGIGERWTYLTGKPEDVEQVRLALGFFDLDRQVDSDISQHTGMVRVGNDALDRWTMVPALAEPDRILECLMAVDPVTRATGRIRTGT